LLTEILRANASTAFGVEHGFADIEDIDDYRRRVPMLIPFASSSKRSPRGSETKPAVG
jgi:hypothetical protein